MTDESESNRSLLDIIKSKKFMTEQSDALDEDTEITTEEYKGAGISKDDLECSVDLSNIIHIAKCSRLAEGEVQGCEVTIDLSAESTDDEFAWIIETNVISTAYSEYHPDSGRLVDERSCSMTQRNKFSQAGDAILEFEKLIEKYDLEELTDPDKNMYPDKDNT